MRIEPVLLDGAAECGLRSFVALGGFLGDDATVDPEIFSYEGPYGVGYLVARFGPRPVPADAPGMSEPHDGSRPAPGPADYAFACVGAYVAGGRAPEPPKDAFYERRAACFVTLKKHGELRGCIGTLEPAETSLGREIARNAHSSALRDPRFPPVTGDELEALTCSVDVLGPSEPASSTDLDPAGLRSHRRGRASARRPASRPAGIDTVDQQVASRCRRPASRRPGVRRAAVPGSPGTGRATRPAVPRRRPAAPRTDD